MPEIVEHIILVIGVTVILRGVLLGVLRLVRLEWASISGRDTLEREDLRHHLRLDGHLHRQVSSDATTMRSGRKLPSFLLRGADDRPFLP